MKLFAVTLPLNLVALAFLACAKVGTPFDESQIVNIETGKTSKEEVESLFGKPFRIGIENGNEVWIYEYNTYSSFEKETSKDLIVVFDKQGKAFSHQVTTSSP